MDDEFAERIVNMKRLYIVVEGQTEEEFVESLLTPYFQQFGIYSVTPVIIHTSVMGKGGFVNYAHLKNKVEDLLRTNSKDIVVTTMVDFFRCPELPFPEKWKSICNHVEQVAIMEKCIADDINDYRFVPNIQLHEFEALLFSSNEGFNHYYSEEEAFKLSSIVNDYDNPEDINSSPNGAPSKRLLAIRDKYDKILEGNVIALTIGLDTMLHRCPRFKAWIDKLIAICRQ